MVSRSWLKPFLLPAALLMALTIILLEPAFNPLRTVHAAQYDRWRSIRYTDRWWNSVNPTFNDYHGSDRIGNDCTNFISQAI